VLSLAFYFGIKVALALGKVIQHHLQKGVMDHEKIDTFFLNCNFSQHFYSSCCNGPGQQ
jgi:hypothetical protein